jgi:DNA-binding MarR family transcriptional regulator
MPDRVIQQNITVPEGAQLLTRLAIAKHLTGMEHVRIFTDSLLEIAMDKDFTGQDLRVLMAIFSGMEYENFYSQSQTVIADQLELKQPHVSKSLSKLVTKGWLKVIGQTGRQKIYRVSPHLALKSRAKNHRQLVEDWEGITDA